MSTLVMTVKGRSGVVVELYENRIVMKRSGFSAFVWGRGSKEVPLRSITSVSMEEATVWSAGRIHFTCGDENSLLAKASGDLLALAPGSLLTNTASFVRSQQESFVALKEKIQSLLSRSATPHTAPSSDADEIAKLAALRDQGILSPTEFEDRKKRLLGS